MKTYTDYILIYDIIQFQIFPFKNRLILMMGIIFSYIYKDVKIWQRKNWIQINPEQLFVTFKPISMRSVKKVITVILLTVCCSMFSCKKETADSETILSLRIMNDVSNVPNNLLTGSISVVVSSNEAATDFDGYKATVDYGTIQIGQTTEYKRVSNRFKITVNGMSFAPNDGLGIGAQPTGKWTLKISSIQSSGGSTTYGWDLSASN